jgi:hypothetical protein
MIDEDDPTPDELAPRARRQFINDWTTTRAWRRMCLALDDAGHPALGAILNETVAAVTRHADTDDARFLLDEASHGATWYETMTHLLHALRCCVSPKLAGRDHEGELCDYIRARVPQAPEGFEKIGQLGGREPQTSTYRRVVYVSWVLEPGP